MQNTEEKRKNKKISARCFTLLKIITAISVFIILPALITFGNGLGVPTWNEVFAFFGMSADLGDELSLSFIDVGSADSCYIKCRDKHILIDAGSELSYERIYTYLKRNGCTHFDAVIISHFDSDHIGSAKKLLANFGADVVYMNVSSLVADEKTDTASELLEYIEENNVSVIQPKNNSKAEFDKLSFEFVSSTAKYNNQNDNSLVFKLKYGEFTALFMGDASKKVENELIASGVDLNVDVLKVSHHGSKTASSEKFLEKVSPEISVVSVGSSDLYLPDHNTMAYINKYSKEILRTDNDGTVVITTDGENLKVYKNN